MADAFINYETLVDITGEYISFYDDSKLPNFYRIFVLFSFFANHIFLTVSKFFFVKDGVSIGLGDRG